MVSVQRPASGARPLILFGGTFDPVHGAHVRAALAVSQVLGNAPVRLLPNAVPPHRPQPLADASERLAMVRLACAGHPALQADDWELRQAGPSYTHLTLQHFRRLIVPFGGGAPPRRAGTTAVGGKGLSARPATPAAGPSGRAPADADASAYGHFRHRHPRGAGAPGAMPCPDPGGGSAYPPPWFV